MAKDATPKRIVYIGPIDKIEVPLLDGSRVVVARGDELTMPAELAAALLAQDGNWQPVPADVKEKEE